MGIENFARVMAEADEPVSISRLVEETDVSNRKEAKIILRKMIDRGLLTTAPGFRYRLGSKGRELYSEEGQ